MNRRSFLAAVPAMGTAAIVPATAAPVKTPSEQALWHIRELERLILDEGGSKPVILVSADYAHGEHRVLALNINGQITSHNNMFA